MGKECWRPLTYSDVYATFKELERKTGIHITPHMFRHTHATIYYLQTKKYQAGTRTFRSRPNSNHDEPIHSPSEDEIRKDWEKAAHAFEIGQENMEDFQSNIPDEAVPFRS